VGHGDAELNPGTGSSERSLKYVELSVREQMVSVVSRILQTFLPLIASPLVLLNFLELSSS
jgi:hypothetical protein